MNREMVSRDWDMAMSSMVICDQAHGRIDTRSRQVIDLSDPEWDGYGALYGRQQAIRIYRKREIIKTSKVQEEITYGLTSLSKDEASPDDLLAMIRGHWGIENRLHFVRDFTCDEDRCRAYIGSVPRNLACLTNFAISIIRVRNQFKFVPQANRHYADQKQKALEEILLPIHR